MADSSNNNPWDTIASSDPAGSAENTVVENTAAEGATDSTSTPDALGATDAAGTAGTAAKVSTKATKVRNKLLAAFAAIIIVAAGLVITEHRINAQADAAAAGTTIVTIGITGSADEPIWQAVQEELDSENAGITVQIKSFEDGTTMNTLNATGELDLTAFQHYAYFEDNIAQNNLDLTSIGDTYIMPLNLYSEKYTDVSQFKSGDKVAIPSDLTNSGRALKVLDSAGLIKLKDNTKASPTLLDIASNPSGIEIVSNDAPTIIGLLPDYAGGITNTNHVQDAGWSVDDAIYHEPVDINNEKYKPYINLIATRTKDKDNPTYQAVVKAYHSKHVADAILQTYKNAVQPAFSY